MDELRGRNGFVTYPTNLSNVLSTLKALERPTDACTIRFMHLRTTGSEDGVGGAEI